MLIKATDIQRALKTALKEAKDNPEILKKTAIHNPWFTPTQSLKAIESWIDSLDQFDEWLSKESIPTTIAFTSKVIGIITAGNIPLVGLHDILCVIVTGHKALIKPSSQDNILLKYILNRFLVHLPEMVSQITFTDGFIKDVDAYIGTGSNNSARYFTYYFNQKPHIIRKNRNSVAILTKNTSQTDLKLLGEDIFSYFGMGCRNVTQIYVPPSFDFSQLFDTWQHYYDIINHHKYANNYTYHKAILLMNLDKHLDNGFILLKENQSIHSPVSMLNYTYYTEMGALIEHLDSNLSEIQCIVGPTDLGYTLPILPYGSSQTPTLWDYSDNINTILFLKELV